MPFKSSEGRNGGKLTKSNLSDNIGGYLLKSVGNSQYFYEPNTETSLYVEPGIKSIVIAGVAPGGDCGPADGDATDGYGGAGGGAGNVEGVTIDAVPLWNQNIYIKVPAAPGTPVHVKTGSQSGTSLWEAGNGAPAPGGSTSTQGAGGVMITGFGYPGGQGGRGQDGPQGFPTANPGSGAAGGAGAGGGGGGGHNEPTSGDDGAPGGAATIPSDWLRPINVGPAPNWTMEPGSGGSGGSGQQSPGFQAQYGGAQGGAAGQNWPNPNGGGGGGGGGVNVDHESGGKQSYGGGGGGKGADHGSGEYVTAQQGQGAGGFIIVQFIKHT